MCGLIRFTPGVNRLGIEYLPQAGLQFFAFRLLCKIIVL
jgi:hypothetical protein